MILRNLLVLWKIWFVNNGWMIFFILYCLIKLCVVFLKFWRDVIDMWFWFKNWFKRGVVWDCGFIDFKLIVWYINLLKLLLKFCVVFISFFFDGLRRWLINLVWFVIICKKKIFFLIIVLGRVFNLFLFNCIKCFLK